MSETAKVRPPLSAAGPKRQTRVSASRFFLIFITALVSASLTGTATFIVTRYQLASARTNAVEQQRLLEKSQMHNARVASLEKLTRLLSDFRTSSFTYFFAELAHPGDETRKTLEEKHAAYHKLDSELNSALAVAPFVFGNEVLKWIDLLDAYFSKYEWEGKIQNAVFKRSVETIDWEVDSLTDRISRAILLEEYDHLTRQLGAAMALEIAGEMEDGAARRDYWARAAADPKAMMEGECSVDRATARVGEVVTFTASGYKGTGYYSYDWNGDDGLRSNEIDVKVTYGTPGTKIANVAMHPVRLGDKPERLFQNRVFCQCKVTIVGDDE